MDLRFRNALRTEILGSMKSIIVSFSLLIAVALPGMAAPEKQTESKTATAEKKAADSNTAVDSKTEKEIVAMENQLRVAIEKCDEVLLKQLLADYFADAYVGREKATTKAGMIARCKAAKLSFLAFNDKPELIRSAEIVTIRGITTTKKMDVEKGNAETSEQLQVRRLWTKSDGRWILIVQERGPLEDEAEREREKQK